MSDPAEDGTAVPHLCESGEHRRAQRQERSSDRDHNRWDTTQSNVRKVEEAIRPANQRSVSRGCSGFSDHYYWWIKHVAQGILLSLKQVQSRSHRQVTDTLKGEERICFSPGDPLSKSDLCFLSCVYDWRTGGEKKKVWQNNLSKVYLWKRDCFILEWEKKKHFAGKEILWNWVNFSFFFMGEMEKSFGSRINFLCACF